MEIELEQLNDQTWLVNDTWTVRLGQVLEPGSVTETRSVYHVYDEDGKYVAQALDLEDDLVAQIERIEEDA